MKRSFPGEQKTRFSGQLRHYHRSGAKTVPTWDEWINGKSARVRLRNWWKILLVALAVIALLGIIIGLFIELR